MSGWGRQDTPVGPITVVAGAHGIAAISWSGDDELDFTAGPSTHRRGVTAG